MTTKRILGQPERERHLYLGMQATRHQGLTEYSAVCSCGTEVEPANLSKHLKGN